MRTRLDVLRPSQEEQVQDKQAQQKDHDRHAHERELEPGQTVMAWNFRPGPDWVQATVMKRLAPLTYEVKLEGGQLWTRHIDHLRQFQGQGSTGATGSSDNDMIYPVTPPAETENEPTNHTNTERPPNEPPTMEPQCYPARGRRPPDRFM